MPPPLASRDSPRTLHGRRRAPRGQLARSGSIFGAIKTIVTAPLAWFTSYDDQENVSGKRGRNTNIVLEDEGVYHEDQPSAKRKRVDSPPAPNLATRTTQGYLDVPENLLSQQSGTRQRQAAPLSHGRSTSLVPSLNVPTIPGVHPTRRTASPTGITPWMQPSMLQRTQSMDPPAYRALSLSRDVSMEEGVPGSGSRDVTMSPSRHTPFQLRPRSSLTPQPAGQTFGPTPRHKQRDASEPPPLAALLSKPVFVKPPPRLAQPSEEPITTLGSLADSKGRFSRSPIRQHSGLFLGARPGSITDSSSTPFVMPTNAAEKALHDLDVYKTPLLPSRLRGSQTIPDMFKPKKTHAPVLMRSDRDRERKPRLGTSEKKGKKEDETAAAAKPYAGRGGLKKMLARRKLEEEEEREKERASAIETDQDEEAKNSVEIEELRTSNGLAEITRLPSPPPVPAAAARPIGRREQSSLRVGRTHISRNHIARPISKSKNRFSAAYEEDEGEDVMLDETTNEEQKKPPTLFESPKGFSFAQDKPPIMHDASNAKEPPISALPFSLTKPSAAAPVVASAPAPPSSNGEPFKAAASAPGPTPARPLTPKIPEAATAATPTAPLFPQVPSISLIPPSPALSKPADDPPARAPAPISMSTTTPPSIPNFFANSSIFAKPGVTIAPPAPSAHAIVGTAKDEPSTTPFSFTFGSVASNTPAPEGSPPGVEAPQPASATTFSFSAPSPSMPSSSSTSPAPLFPTPPAKENGKNLSSSSLFATTAPAKETSHAPAPETKQAAPVSTLFPSSQPTKVAELSSASSSLPFTFGSSPALSPAPVTTPSVSQFTFGQTEAVLNKRPETKPLFGVAEPAKPILFGAPAPAPSPFGGSQGSTGGEAPKPPFQFGQPTPSSSNTGSTIEAPKPLFPSTSTGGTGGFSFSSPTPTAPSPATPAKSPFQFGAAPSTPPVNTPVENKSAFNFAAPATPAVSAPTTLFGGPSTGSHGADVSKPFTFAAAAPARPITPPQKEQEMRMEESPTRGGGMDINGEQAQSNLKPSNVFTFGAPNASTPSLFAQPTPAVASPFSFGGKTDSKLETKLANSFASFGQNSTTPAFPFGQKPAEQSPISPAPFGSSTPFGSNPTASASPFNFAAPTITTSGFGQPSPAVNSQPASPSTFGQPTSFTFGATPTSATAPTNPFAFGSQPASPATGNAGLPQPPGSSGGPTFAFGASGSATQTPSSPFGASPGLPTPGGNVAFTIGSAAPQAPGARQIKKLPNRRGGRPR